MKKQPIGDRNAIEQAEANDDGFIYSVMAQDRAYDIPTAMGYRTMLGWDFTTQNLGRLKLLDLRKKQIYKEWSEMSNHPAFAGISEFAIDGWMSELANIARAEIPHAEVKGGYRSKKIGFRIVRNR